MKRAQTALLMSLSCFLSALAIFVHRVNVILVLQVRILGAVGGCAVESSESSSEFLIALSVRFRHLRESIVLHAVMSD